MTLKDKILLDLIGIQNPNVLNQIFDFIQSIKQKNSISDDTNKEQVLQFAGEINDEDASEISEIVDLEFNAIEGDW